MNKNEFFNVLMDSLKDIPEKKLQNIILYYENLFNSEMSKGKSEEEIVSNLGNIDILINKCKEDSIRNEAEKDITDSFFNTELSNNDYLKLEKNYLISTETTENCNTEDTSYSYATDNNSGSVPNNTTIKKTVNINSILKVCILILSLIIFSPIFASVFGIIMGILGSAIGLLFGSIGILIGGTFTSFAGIPNLPHFISNFPYPVLVLFCLGSVTLSIMLFILFCYMIKALIIGIKKLYSLLMS